MDPKIKEPQKVIFDTNIFVAAGFNKRCRSAKLLTKVREGELLLVWNRNTRGETERTIKKIPPLRQFSLKNLFLREGRFEGPTHAQSFTYVPHVPDRKFAALGHAAGVPVISRDVHLLESRDQGPAQVFSPEEFMSWREKKKGSG